MVINLIFFFAFKNYFVITQVALFYFRLKNEICTKTEEIGMLFKTLTDSEKHISALNKKSQTVIEDHNYSTFTLTLRCHHIAKHAFLD